MATSKILIELANNDVTLEIALSRLLVIACKIDDEALKVWATKELSGYDNEDECPRYRQVTSTGIIYSGLNGSFQIKNAPLPLNAFPSCVRDILVKPYEARESIATINKIVCEKTVNKIDITAHANMVFTHCGIQCYEIMKTFDYTLFDAVLNSLRMKLLNVFIELDKQLGNLDGLDPNATSVDLDKLHHTIYNMVYIDNSIELGDKNKIQKLDLSQCSTYEAKIGDENKMENNNIVGGSQTIHNNDNRGAIIGAIGNDNTVNQSVNIGNNTQELLDLVSDMRNIIKTADIDTDNKMDLAVALNNIKEECKSSNPNKSKLIEAIKLVGVKITGTAVATSLKPYIEKTVDWFRNSNFLTPEQCIEIINTCSK